MVVLEGCVYELMRNGTICIGEVEPDYSEWDDARLEILSPGSGEFWSWGDAVAFEAVVYYADGDPADGLFTTGGAANTGTSVDGNGLFAVPAAQLTTYQPAAPGGYEFTSTPLAALPASAVIVAFTAENM